MKKILLFIAIVATLATLFVPLIVTSNTHEEFDTALATERMREKEPSPKVEPAGGSNIITNPNIELAIYSDWADVHLPIYQGFTPPYRIVMVNTSITNLADFATVQTDNGWTISFDSWLYSSNDYTFTLEVYSKTGGATLSVSSSFYPTTSYWGSVMPIY